MVLEEVNPTYKRVGLDPYVASLRLKKVKLSEGHMGENLRDLRSGETLDTTRKVQVTRGKISCASSKLK